MNEITFFSTCNNDAVNALKILSLYFEKIEVIGNVLYQIEPDNKSKGTMEQGDVGTVVGVTEFVDNTFIKKVKPLLDENILKILEEDFVEKHFDKKHREEIENNVFELLEEKPELIIKTSNIEFDEATGKKKTAWIAFADNEVKKVHEKHIGKIGLGKIINLGFIYKYYSTLLTDLFTMLSLGNVPISNSNIITSYLNYTYNNKRFDEFSKYIKKTANITPQIAQNIFELTLFDVSKFTFEEILEIKYKLRDELERFRTDLSLITHNIQNEYEDTTIVNNLKEIVKSRILPSVNELEDKIKNSRIQLLVRLFEALKNPTAYVPFLGTTFHMIPVQLAFFLSLGLISFDTAIEYIAERKQLTNNGLYYLIKLKKIIKSH
jgi:hypothetical protein